MRKYIDKYILTNITTVINKASNLKQTYQNNSASAIVQGAEYGAKSYNPDVELALI